MIDSLPPPLPEEEVISKLENLDKDARELDNQLSIELQHAGMISINLFHCILLFTNFILFSLGNMLHSIRSSISSITNEFMNN